MKQTRLYAVFLIYCAMCGATMAKKLPEKQMMIQLYSVRELIGSPELYAKNHVEVFRQLRRYGITMVEGSDGSGFGVSPEQFLADCQEAGLTPVSAHVGNELTDEELSTGDFSKKLEWWKAKIDSHKRVGCRYMVTSWAPFPANLHDAQVWCNYHDEVGRMCREAGIKYGYHTHSHEYGKVKGQVWIDFMMQHIAPENMFWQMDVYWCVMAQESPVKWFRKYPGRFRLLHIKDKHEVGYSGMVGFDAIFRNADVAGLEGYVVELENTDGTIGIMEGVRRSVEYLRKLPFVKNKY